MHYIYAHNCRMHREVQSYTLSKVRQEMNLAYLSMTLLCVTGGRGSLSLAQGSVSIANQVFSKFLGRQPHVRSDLGVPETSKEDRMKLALSKLADIMKDSSIANRNPHSPISFSCLPQGVIQAQTDLLVQSRKGRQDAFSPVGSDGKPLRRYIITL